MKTGEEFFNLYAHDLLRVAVGTPVLVLFPELGLSAYTCDDLFHQRALLDGCLEAPRGVVEAAAALPLVSVVGVPLEVDHVLYNCAAIVDGGRLLGVVPKTYLPTYRESTSAGSSPRATPPSARASTCSASATSRSAAACSSGWRPSRSPRSTSRSARTCGRLRFGYAPAKLAFLAWCAWHDVHRLAEIKRALAIFLERFFELSQFKRSCMPNAPKVGSDGSLSPRADWRAPSDAEATVWLTQLALIPDVEEP